MESASLTGGIRHGLAALSHAEREAAQKALAKLTGSGSATGSSLRGLVGSATVLGGGKSAGTGVPSLLHGHGNDTFIGGARGALTPAAPGSDTISSGSVTKLGGPPSVAEALGRHGGHIALSTDTISVAGATAESVKSGQAPAAGGQTITLTDKTTVTIKGVSAHDITKGHH